MNEFVSTLLMDKQGRIIIPLKVRELLGLKAGEMLRIECSRVDGIITLFAVGTDEENKK